MYTLLESPMEQRSNSDGEQGCGFSLSLRLPTGGDGSGGSFENGILRYGVPGCYEKEFVGLFLRTLGAAGHVPEGVPWLARRVVPYADEDPIHGRMVVETVCQYEVLLALPFRSRIHGMSKWRLDWEEATFSEMERMPAGETVAEYILKVLLRWSVQVVEAGDDHGWVFIGPGFRLLGIDGRGFVLGHHWV